MPQNQRLTKGQRNAIKSARRQVTKCPEPLQAQRALNGLRIDLKTGRR